MSRGATDLINPHPLPSINASSVRDVTHLIENVGRHTQSDIYKDLRSCNLKNVGTTATAEVIQVCCLKCSLM